RISLDNEDEGSVKIFHEPDETCFVGIERSNSGAYLFMTTRSHTTSEVYYLRADQPRDEFHMLQARQPWVEYYVTHHGDHFLIRTNEGAQNFRLMAAPITNPAKENWREVVP